MLRYAGSVSSDRFNIHDDFHAYFVYPEKMLQTGSFGPDPYSERRLAQLRAQSFLHTFVLVLGSEKNLFTIDAGLGIIITLGLITAHMKAR